MELVKNAKNAIAPRGWRSLVRREGFLVPLIAYRLALDITYQFGVSIRYAYLGSTYAFNVLWIVESWVVMLLGYIVLGKKQDLYSSIVSLLYLIIIVPACSFYAMSDHAKNDGSLTYLCAIVACFAMTALIGRIGPKPKQPIRKLPFAALDIILSFVMLLVVVALFFTCGGIHIEAVDIFNIYGIREEIETTGILAYLHVWCYRVVGPYLILKNVLKRQYLLTGFWLLVQGVIYLITPFKEVLFIPVIMFACLVLYRRGQFARDLCWLFAALCVLALALSIWFDAYGMLS